MKCILLATKNKKVNLPLEKSKNAETQKRAENERKNERTRGAQLHPDT